MKKTLLLLVAALVSATAWAGVYNFNSTTGELKLLSGEFNKSNKWGNDVTASAVKSVTAAAGVSFTGDCDELFYNFTNCESMDLNNVNTANATSMVRLFRNCSSLASLDLSGWNNASVWNMSNMFRGCSGLTSLNLSGFNTENVTSMSSMFYGCSSLTTLDLSAFNTAQVTTMGYMFKDCSSLTMLDLSSFNTALVTNMNYMFDGCSSLTTIYAGSGWNTTNVESSDDMFAGCTALVGGMGTVWTSRRIDKTYARIDRGTSERGYLTGVFALTLPEGVTAAPAATLTHGEVSLYAAGTSVNLSYSGTVPEGTSPVYSVNGTAIVGSTFEMPFEDVTVAITGYQTRYTYDSATGALALLWGEFNSAYKWGGDVVASAVTSVTATDEVIFTGDCSSLFDGFDHCVSMDLSNVITAHVTDMSSMFNGCSALTTIYAGTRWSTAKVTSSAGMFAGCTALVGGKGTTYDSGHVDKEYARFDKGTSEPGYLTGVFTLTLPENVTASPAPTLMHGDVSLYAAGTTVTLSYNGTVPEGAHLVYLVNGTAIAGNTFEMPFEDVTVTTDIGRRYTFNEDTGVLTLLRGEFNYANKWGDDVPSSAVKSVTATSAVSFTGDCSWLFYRFTNCLSIDLHNVNTDSVTNMSHMFDGCQSLTSLDVSGWNTASVTQMSSVFQGCSSLTSLDLSGWNTVKVTDMGSMFVNCSGLTSLDVSGWNTAKVTNMSNMFSSSGLTSLDLSAWNTAQVTNMNNMFFCSQLTSLDLSNWNTAKVTDMGFMFEYSGYLTTIYVSTRWSTANVTSSEGMFHGCSILVGGKGTALDANHVDKEYARIDGGPDNPGYFTQGYQRGDINHDGKVDVSDVNIIINIMLGKTQASSYPGNPDLNNDNKVDVTDVNAVINIMLGKE